MSKKRTTVLVATILLLVAGLTFNAFAGTAVKQAGVGLNFCLWPRTTTAASSTTRTPTTTRITTTTAATTARTTTAATTTAAPTTTTPGLKGIDKFVVLRYVNSETVRASANPGAASLGSLANGKQLELMQAETIKYNDYTWYFKVVYEGKTGYIRTRYMDEVRPDGYFAVQPDYSKYTDYVRVKVAGNLNVRTSADLSSATNILARRAEHGDVLALKSATQVNGCWQVEFDGRTAYVSAGTSYTERIQPTAIPSGNTAAQNASWAAIVNQKNQTVSVYRNKTLVRFMTCTTGGTTEDRLTPVGTYTHRLEMNGLPGKKSLFLSWHTNDPEKEIFGEEDLTVFDCVRITGGVYFHRIPRQANNSYDYYKARLNAAGSHGCIRLPEVHSRWMYDNFAYGGVVVVQPL